MTLSDHSKFKTQENFVWVTPSFCGIDLSQVSSYSIHLSHESSLPVLYKLGVTCMDSSDNKRQKRGGGRGWGFVPAYRAQVKSAWLRLLTKSPTVFGKKIPTVKAILFVNNEFTSFSLSLFRLFESGNQDYFVTSLAPRPPVFDCSTVIVFLIFFCIYKSSGTMWIRLFESHLWYYFVVSLAPRIHL